VPIDVGGRVSGKAGRYSIGLIDIRTGEAPRQNLLATNFSVVRVKRDILRRSAIGALFTDRSNSSLGNGRSQAFGVDGMFAFFQNLSVNTYLAQTTRSATAARSTTTPTDTASRSNGCSPTRTSTRTSASCAVARSGAIRRSCASARDPSG